MRREIVELPANAKWTSQTSLNQDLLEGVPLRVGEYFVDEIYLYKVSSLEYCPITTSQSVTVEKIWTLSEEEAFQLGWKNALIAMKKLIAEQLVD